jgi:hypothetical protein
MMKHLATLVVSSLLGIAGCALEPAPDGSTDPASTSLVTAQEPLSSLSGLDRCREDILGLADVPGRNGWAGMCGYLTPAAVEFFNEESTYLVFTTGCGHSGCNPFVGVTLTDPCVAGLTKLELCFTD